MRVAVDNYIAWGWFGGGRGGGVGVMLTCLFVCLSVVFNALVVTCLRHLGPALVHHIPVDPSCQPKSSAFVCLSVCLVYSCFVICMYIPVNVRVC